MEEKNTKEIVNIEYIKSYKHWFQLVFILIIAISCIQIQNHFWEIFNRNIITFLQTPKYILSLISFILLIRFLQKPRYFVLDIATSTLEYHYAFRAKKYAFSKIETVQIETDMSKALLQLKTKIREKIFLKLHNKKTLFIGEFLKKEKSDFFANKCAKFFQVEIEKLQKIGHRKTKEVNLGHYAIEKEISHGGMGKVFLGRDIITQKKVAIKVLPANLALKDNNANNFAKETCILQKLSHPNIIKILNVGREKSKKRDVYFYAMEHIKGFPLSHYIKEKNLTIEQSVRYTIQIALALDYIHSHKVVHRDIKPDNIMIRDEGSCVLIDFGIARDISMKERIVYKGAFRHRPEISHFTGTIPYMSPEQISSRHYIDYRTDLYSLGITLYEMLVNERLFKGNEIQVMRAILTTYPSTPSSKNSFVPKELDRIVLKSIARNKNKRYQSGASFARELHYWLHKIPITKKKRSFFQIFFSWYN